MVTVSIFHLNKIEVALEYRPRMKIAISSWLVLQIHWFSTCYGVGSNWPSVRRSTLRQHDVKFTVLLLQWKTQIEAICIDKYQFLETVHSYLYKRISSGFCHELSLECTVHLSLLMSLEFACTHVFLQRHSNICDDNFHCEKLSI